MAHKVLAIIPARGGSKGVPGKNIREVGGKPLIGYSIEEALKAKKIDKLIVSTDSEEIAEIARKFNAEVPFMRPDKLATDSALTVDVVKHAINYFKESGEVFDSIVLLQPTCPLRKAEDIDKSIDMLWEKDTDSVVSLSDVGANHPARMYFLDPENKMENVINEDVSMMPRQALPKVYIRSGDIYTCKTERVLKEGKMLFENSVGMVMEGETVNIDTFDDLHAFERFLEK